MVTVWHQNSLALDKEDDLQQNSKEYLQVFLVFFMGLSILLIDNAAMKDRKKERNKER